MQPNNLFDTYQEEQTGFVDNKLTVSSKGFEVESFTKLDAELKTVFSEIRNDLVHAFNDAVERLQEEQEESERLDARLGGAIHK